MALALLAYLVTIVASSGHQVPAGPLKPESNSSHRNAFGKGFIRGSRNDYVGTLTITQADRDNAPTASDWTSATSAVKNQGSCGSCWAYSTTEGIETAYWFATGRPATFQLFSDQQIISCDSGRGDDGCKGGDPMPALDYVVSAGGLEPQVDYPDSSTTSGTTGTCNANAAETIPFEVSWWKAVPTCEDEVCTSQDEDGLAAALNKYGPLSICLNANWDNYIGWHYDGVYTGLDGTCSSNRSKVDHCVQLVGYDKSASPPYWKIRNSWSADWGENGYIRIPYGQNYCGVANEAYYISVSAGTKPVSNATVVMV